MCKSEREEDGDSVFVDEYGVNENGATHLRKCVSKEPASGTVRDRDEGVTALSLDDLDVIGSARAGIGNRGEAWVFARRRRLGR